MKGFTIIYIYLLANGESFTIRLLKSLVCFLLGFCRCLIDLQKLLDILASSLLLDVRLKSFFLEEILLFYNKKITVMNKVNNFNMKQYISQPS